MRAVPVLTRILLVALLSASAMAKLLEFPPLVALFGLAGLSGAVVLVSGLLQVLAVGMLIPDRTVRLGAALGAALCGLGARVAVASPEGLLGGVVQVGGVGLALLIIAWPAPGPRPTPPEPPRVPIDPQALQGQVTLRRGRQGTDAAPPTPWGASMARSVDRARDPEDEGEGER